MQIGEMIRRAAQRYGDAPALVCGEQTMSFSQFDQATDRFGNALRGLGLRAGDRVAVLLPNGIECMIAYYSLAKAGLVRVPLNTRETLLEQEYKLEYVGARALIHNGNANVNAEFLIGPEDFSKMLKDGSASICAVDRELEAPLRLGFTGGTTGNPKAVTLTTRGEIAEIAAFMMDLIPGIDFGDTMLHAAPIGHASGAFFLPHLLRGARSVIMPKFDADTFIDVAEREGATCTFLVPTMIAMVLERSGIAGAKFKLRRLCYGASSIAPSLAKRAMMAFGPILAQTYGQAESPMVITLLQPDEHDREASCGRPYTFVEARVVDDEDRVLMHGEVGEIVCRGPQLMARYWNKPEETEKTMRNGWLHTGDLGYMDREGFFYIADRKNDLIISGGYNIYPREIEDVLLSVNGVLEAAVIGLPDEKWGDRVHAVISVRQGISAESVYLSSCHLIASYKRPKEIEIWPELPKSAAGKILRRKIREAIIARQ
jgi:acyl-CoA synthetase (AMP-forming)/AMP-acid ligase II